MPTDMIELFNVSSLGFPSNVVSVLFQTPSPVPRDPSKNQKTPPALAETHKAFSWGAGVYHEHSCALICLRRPQQCNQLHGCCDTFKACSPNKISFKVLNPPLDPREKQVHQITPLFSPTALLAPGSVGGWKRAPLARSVPRGRRWWPSALWRHRS